MNIVYHFGKITLKRILKQTLKRAFSHFLKSSDSSVHYFEHHAYRQEIGPLCELKLYKNMVTKSKHSGKTFSNPTGVIR